MIAARCAWNTPLTAQILTKSSAYYMGIIELNEGNDSIAKDYFLSIAADPEFREDVALYLTQIDLVQGRCTQVIRHLEPIVNTSSRAKQAAIKGTMGQAYFCAGDCEKATPLLEEYIETLRQPDYGLYYQVGSCSYQSDQYEKAIKYLKELTSAPSDLGQHAMYTIANSYLALGDKEKLRPISKMLGYRSGCSVKRIIYRSMYPII